MRDKSRNQSSDSSGTYGRLFKMSALNEDLDLELRHNVCAALFNMNDGDSDGAPRQQFDSISKDILSSMVQNFDPQPGSSRQNLNMRGCQTFEQKWWSLFGKYWLVKNERNDYEVKMMQWLMTGGNHGIIDTCGENLSMNCDEIYKETINHSGSQQECIGSSRFINANSINTPAKLLKLELGSQIPIKSPFKLKRRTESIKNE